MKGTRQKYVYNHKAPKENKRKVQKKKKKVIPKKIKRTGKKKKQEEDRDLRWYEHMQVQRNPLLIIQNRSA